MGREGVFLKLANDKITSLLVVYFRVPSEGEASARTETPR